MFSPDEISSDTEIAWAAGFFDGEGWSTSQKAKQIASQRRYLQIGLGQNDRSTLDRFHKAVRGFGSICCAVKGRANPYWIWRAGGREGYRVIELLWPFLSQPKRDQFMRVEAELE